MLVNRVLSVVVAVAVVGCGASGSSFESVTGLYEAAGGQDWCDGELNVTLEPFVGNCGDPATDGRVVLSVSPGGEEIRASVDRARGNLVDDGQLLLVPEDPDQEMAWQLRSRDPDRLRTAQEAVGGTVLESEADVDAWLDQ